MEQPQKVTKPLLEALEQLLGYPEGIHGYALIKATGRRPGTVYTVLDRLADADWVVRRWDTGTTPARRVYRLTPTGAAKAKAVLASQRPNRITVVI